MTETNERPEDRCAALTTAETYAADAGAEAAGDTADRIIEVPECYSFVTPLLYAVPVQLLAYHTAVVIGTDVDQPRNLAKSVTVE